MIVKMSRYDFVLLATQSDDFIARLRELGLVDITTTGWETQDKDRQLLSDIDRYRKAIETLNLFTDSEEYAFSSDDEKRPQPYTSGKETFEKYNELRQQKAALQAEILRLEKSVEELKPWGEFDSSMREKLLQQGVVLRFFQTQSSVFDKCVEEWSASYTVVEIYRDAAAVYFVIVTTPGAEIIVDAQEVKAPAMDSRTADAEADKCREKLKPVNYELSVCALSVEALEQELDTLVRQLQDVKIKGTATEAADGALVVMEGWAEEDKSAEVDKLLDEYSDVIYLKRDAEREDDTPVKLKNNRFARLFELIGAMYALPKYGTMDLTPFFAPFYMLFFAICLNDAGYGAILTLVGLILLRKGGQSLKQAAWLTVFCGGATTLFGFYTGSLFGMSIPDMLGYDGIANSPFLDFQNQFFSLALALGVVQILFGMFLNICLQTKLFGFTSTFGLLGWFIILLSGCVAVGLPMMNEAFTISWFTTSSPAFYAAMGVGAVLMLLLNNIKRNPLINIGSGLWDAYNNITGLLSDVLSYIRLFAIGLSGGVLAQVFNSLAMGLTGLDAGIESFGVGTIFQIIGAAAILLIGHGINLFMSSISSFVHPMRLTFVEFYKNAGFEMTTRQFEPLTNEKK